MVISIIKLVNDLKIETPDLITRQLGRKIFDAIHGKMNAVQDNEVVVIDFQHIRVIDSSFIDELILKLILQSRKSLFPFFIKLKNISDAVEINIDLVLNSYSSYINDRIVINTDNICRNNSYFIGPLSERERDIVDYLRINKSASVDDLVQFTGMNTDDITHIMDELHSIRVIRKKSENTFMPV